MFEIASEWKLRVSQQKTIVANQTFISAIEPDIIFTSNTIGIQITSPSAPNHWYAAGEFLQIYLVGFGTAGYAQGESIETVLNRHHIHRFTKFPVIPGKDKYLVSFVPKPYLKDITLKVWEYAGTNQGITLESLDASVKAIHQRVIVEGTAIKSLLKKIQEK